MRVYVPPSPGALVMAGAVSGGGIPMSTIAAHHRPSSGGPPASMGGRIVVGIVLLAAALAAFAVWFQWNQTRRCLALYGPERARAIQTAPRVERWRLTVDPQSGRPLVAERQDLSNAPGLVHLRRGLVEDANFAWPDAAGDRLPAAAWDEALVFYTSAVPTPAVILAVDLDDGGWLTAVGRPGRVGLGRLRKGLQTWIDATRPGSP